MLIQCNLIKYFEGNLKNDMIILKYFFKYKLPLYFNLKIQKTKNQIKI